MTIGLIIGMFVYLILQWGNMPDKIPGHYNIQGEVDRWGSKWEIFVLPSINLFMYGFLTLIGAYPSIWNVPTAKNQENNRAVYQCAKSLLIVLKLEIVLWFLIISVFVANGKSMPILLTPIILIVITMSLVIFVIKMYRIAKR